MLAIALVATVVVAYIGFKSSRVTIWFVFVEDLELPISRAAGRTNVFQNHIAEKPYMRTSAVAFFMPCGTSES
ncbi:MAG: hypothetical protein UX07_C0022G0014 [Parcubacteria group bacterium GW2011_GWA2_45_30]|nr:MAG: hypothetical protein UX07_C0022G0014 [Parcubacteria group bacterium GW2011_GWA2_45_30]